MTSLPLPKLEEAYIVFTTYRELLTEFLYVPTQVASVQAKIKTSNDLPSLLNKVNEALNGFAQVVEFVTKKTGDTGLPLAGQASSHPAKGEKNTQQVKI
ncbi:hypothetical protein Tco_0130141, partial [Tanacetum coccineum]